jgi:hypothetical protein
MMVKRLLLFLFFVFSISIAHAIYPFIFEQISRNTHYGDINSISVCNDSTVFILNDALVQMMKYQDNDLKLMSEINVRNAKEVEISQDGTVFIASENYLYAYEYEDSVFTQLAKRSMTCERIAVSEDNTVYIAHGWNGGLSVYQFSGSSFSRKDYISYSYSYAYDVKIAPDGTIFVAFGAKGLQAYSYDGSQLTLLGSIYDSHHFIRDKGKATEIAFGDNGLIFLANGGDGLRAYAYHNGVFTRMGERKDPKGRDSSTDAIAASSNNRVYINTGGWGVYIYDWADSSFINAGIIADDIEGYGLVNDLALCNDSLLFLTHTSTGLLAMEYEDDELDQKMSYQYGGFAQNVYVGSDSLIYLANGTGGLRIYRHVGNEFINVLHKMEGSSCIDVDMTLNGKLVCLNQDDGIYVYDMAGDSLQTLDHVTTSSSIEIEIGKHNGKLYSSRGANGLNILYFDGTSFRNWYTLDIDGYTYGACIDNNRHVFLANAGNGLCVYNDNNGRLTEIDRVDTNTVTDVAVSDEGTIYVTSHSGLRAYALNGENLVHKATAPERDWLHKVEVFNDRTVFTTSAEEIMAYHFNGSQLIKIGEMKVGYGTRIAFADDSTIYMARRNSGLFAYHFVANPNPAAYYPEDYILSQNYPNPFNAMTSFNYSIPNFTDVKISIYDISGKEIRSWFYQNRYPDNYTIVWNGTNMSGEAVPSGIYIYRIAANNFNVSKKMVLMK